MPGGVGGRQESLRRDSLVRGEGRGSFEGTGCGTVTAAPQGESAVRSRSSASSRVRAECRGCPVPRPAVRLVRGSEGVGEGLMCGPALARGRRLSDRRPDERVAELERRPPHRHQARDLRGVESLRIDPVGDGRPEHRGQQAAGVGRDERRACVGVSVGSRAYPVQEQALDVRREGQGVRQRLAAGQLILARVRQGAPSGPGRCRRHARQGLSRRAAAMPADRLLDQPVRRGRGRSPEARGSAGREPRTASASPSLAAKQDHDALRAQTPGHEQQRVRRRGVDPLHVVDQADDGPLLGELGQQGEAGGRDQEPALAARLGKPEGPAQRVGLWVGESVEQIQRRGEELVQPCERQLGLGLHTPRSQDSHVGGVLAHALQQRGLPDSWVAPDRPVAPLRETRAPSSSSWTRPSSSSRPYSTSGVYRDPPMPVSTAISPMRRRALPRDARPQHQPL